MSDNKDLPDDIVSAGDIDEVVLDEVGVVATPGVNVPDNNEVEELDRSKPEAKRSTRAHGDQRETTVHEERVQGDKDDMKLKMSVKTLKAAQKTFRNIQQQADESGYLSVGEDSDIEDDAEVMEPRLVRQVGAAAPLVEKYQVPDKEDIKEYRRKHHLFNPVNQGSLSVFSTNVGRPIIRRRKKSNQKANDIEKQGEEVSKLGPGISSYFFFLQLYGWAFFLFGLIASPAMFFNFVVGEYVARYSKIECRELVSSRRCVQCFYCVRFRKRWSI